MSTLPLSLPRDELLDPEHKRVLRDAFETWEAMKSDSTSHMDGRGIAARAGLAKCIIEMAKLGERDQHCLRAGLAYLAEVETRLGD